MAAMHHRLTFGGGDKGAGRKVSEARRRSVWGLAGLLLALGLLGCGHQPLVSESAGTPSLGVVLAADKAVYAQGEPIELILEVVNHGAQPITLRFSSAQRYDVVVQAVQGHEVWRWSSDRAFAQVLGEETLAAGRNLTYRISVREPLPPGRYLIVGIMTVIGEQLSASTEITVR